MKAMISWLATFWLVLLIPVGAEEHPDSPYFSNADFYSSEHVELNPKLSKLYSAIENKLKEDYPDLLAVNRRNSFAFRCNIKVYPVKHYMKDGTEQSRFNKEAGPDKNGIMFDLSYGGHYNGQLAVPSVVGSDYFKTWVAAPRSNRLNCNVYVHFTYPPEAGQDLVRSIEDIVNHWDEYVDG